MPSNRLKKLIPGSIWRHSKKQLDYLIVGIATSTDDILEKRVIYRQLYPAKIPIKEPEGPTETEGPTGTDFLKDYQLWDRSLDEFLGRNETNLNRFEYCGISW